jgi:hypothetical protein
LRITFQADADLDPDIAKGSRRREPSLDLGVATLERRVEKLRDKRNNAVSAMAV